MDWRIYYDDKAPFSSDDGGPEDAPALGVQIIVQNDPDVGRFFQSRSDYYVWDGVRWWGVDIFGLWDYLVRPGLKVVLFGRTIENRVFQKIIRWAKDDKEFAPKSAYLPGENRLE